MAGEGAAREGFGEGLAGGGAPHVNLGTGLKIGCRGLKPKNDQKC